jgi:hypothetical protein
MNKRGCLKRGVFSKNYRVKSEISLNNSFPKNYKGQVWVETVIYLLIAFVMMGLVLSFIRPKIEELRDKAVIEQSLEILKNIDNLILTIGSPGNTRVLEVGITKGSLIIDSANDTIIFQMDSSYTYTEPGQPVQIGNINALTETTGRTNVITLKRDFRPDYNITYQNGEVLKTLTQASTPYRLLLENKGELLNNKTINFDIV